MLKIELSTMLVLSEPYTANYLRDVFKTVVRERVKPGDLQVNLLQLVSDIESTSRLRNAVAHSRWTEGSRDGAIRPMHIDIRAGKLKQRGHNPDEPDWTAQDVEDEVRKLVVVEYTIAILITKYGLEKNILPEQD